MLPTSFCTIPTATTQQPNHRHTLHKPLHHSISAHHHTYHQRTTPATTSPTHLLITPYRPFESTTILLNTFPSNTLHTAPQASLTLIPFTFLLFRNIHFFLTFSLHLAVLQHDLSFYTYPFINSPFPLHTFLLFPLFPYS